MHWYRLATDYSKEWERPGGGERRQMSVQEEKQIANNLEKYIDKTILYDPYLQKLQIEPEHPGQRIIGRSVILRYSSDEVPYSKSLKKEVIVDLVVAFSLKDPPKWMAKSMGWDLEEEAKQEFRVFEVDVQYFDPDTGKVIKSVFSNPPTKNIDQAIENAKKFMARDLVIGDDEDEDPKPEPKPVESIPVPEETPVLQYAHKKK